MFRLLSYLLSKYTTTCVACGVMHCKSFQITLLLKWHFVYTNAWHVTVDKVWFVLWLASGHGRVLNLHRQHATDADPWQLRHISIYLTDNKQYIPNACSLPRWKSSSSWSKLCSICRTSATSVRNECSVVCWASAPSSDDFPPEIHTEHAINSCAVYTVSQLLPQCRKDVWNNLCWWSATGSAAFYQALSVSCSPVQL